MRKYYKYIGSDDPDSYFIVEQIDGVHCKGGHFVGKVIGSFGSKIHNIGYMSNAWVKEYFEPYEMSQDATPTDYWEEAIEKAIEKTIEELGGWHERDVINYLKANYSLIPLNK